LFTIGQFDCPIFIWEAKCFSLDRQSGIVMIPIILGSIVALAIILERFWTWKIRIDFQQFAHEIFIHVERGQFQRALERCEK
jgi:biopolymer transport protein ExbB/TolQ